ncbi:PQQ-dependent sugar dehydrogenase [Chamaesiphon sp. VAR_69_metabat_338]|uniref:PQQ-dependent sugar dehydrogenase n=1 Tax=Chamaesiphon sp. VAR_69_metabat_338 TaxID=2964704 RepID=UPI0037C05E80
MNILTKFSWRSLALKTIALAVISSLACSSNAQKSPVSQSAQANYRLVPVVSGLENPWSVAWLPDRTMLVTERPGRLRIVRNGVLDPTAIGGVPAVFASGQGGLMDVSLHPQFAKNRLVYLTYAHGNDTANRTRLARAVFDGKNLKNLQVIFEVTPVKPGSQHFGSRIVWLPDNTLLLAIGDGGNPPLQIEGKLPRFQAQNRRSQLGKVLRLKDDGSIPRDNPFVKAANINPAIWSYGHRNIQGMTFDPVTKRVWATEHGSNGGDELNLVQKGKNYGWPLATYSKEYGSSSDISPNKSLPGLEDPKAVWTPAIAPSGLTTYNGKRFPQWQKNLFAGGLVDRAVRRIELDANGKVLNQEQISIGSRVRDVRQGPDELLYILTDESDGKLIRLEPAQR